jgi:FkbM family methyltransferase
MGGNAGSMSELCNRLALACKNWIFGGRGEPYRVGGTTLRFVPGTRPVRLRYQTAENAVNRYDAMQLAWMLDRLNEGDIAVDVGANSGQCAVVMAQRCGPTGAVVAFEPNPHARVLLNRNFDLNPTIKRATIESFACSDAIHEEVELYHNGNASNSALVRFRDSNRCSQSSDSFRVPVTTLDSYFAQWALPAPRYVKIDTEGAEIRVLQGARDLLSSSAEILCELHPFAWPLFGNSLQELRNLVARYGRRMRYLDQGLEIGDEAAYGIVTLERI